MEKDMLYVPLILNVHVNIFLKARSKQDSEKVYGNNSNVHILKM